MLEESAAEAWREEQRRTYSSGDTGFLARQQQPLAQRLVEAAAISPGERVLDVGAGTGNVAVGAARRGGVVTAVDLTPHQVEAGRARCAAEGVEVDWHVADAEQLPVLGGTFDVVLSNFGVVYAAVPERAAAEATRVLAPGGRVLLTAYPRDSFNGEALEVINRFWPGAVETPVVDEYLWSDPTSLARWFAGHEVEITRHDELRDAYPSPAAWWESMRSVPVVERLRAGLPQEQFEAFGREIQACLQRYADLDPDGTVHPRSGYVVVRVTA